MESPSELSWIKHSIKRIITTTPDYQKARIKLKKTEVLLDINSDSDFNEKLKRSRKHRACVAKESDDDSVDENAVIVPSFPKISSTNEIRKRKWSTTETVPPDMAHDDNATSNCSQQLRKDSEVHYAQTTSACKNMKTANKSSLTNLVKTIHLPLENYPKTSLEHMDLEKADESINNKSIFSIYYVK
ncbi:uncharacterized protein [Linepithema humile]|uniref:uncharacterized protein n=1 Tax=Linepithema humile TaxID=83485 RepID=UPI0006239FE7|nr:PREDICTED: uncharacterized protein LOC105669429 [Linepithema humile]